MVHPHVVGQDVERVCRHIPDLLHRAIGIETEELELVADVLMPRLAGRAFAAMVERPHDHLLTFPHILHAFAHGGDRP